VVEPETEPALAVIMVVPAAAGTAMPRLLELLLIEATAVAEEFQVTDTSVCVLLSLKVPVATNWWVVVAEIVVFVGATVIETSPAGVSVGGWYSSAVAREWSKL